MYLLHKSFPSPLIQFLLAAAAAWEGQLCMPPTPGRKPALISFCTHHQSHSFGWFICFQFGPAQIFAFPGSPGQSSLNPPVNGRRVICHIQSAMYSQVSKLEQPVMYNRNLFWASQELDASVDRWRGWFPTFLRHWYGHRNVELGEKERKHDH